MRVLFWLMSWVPLPILYGFSTLFTWLVFYVLPYRKKIVLANLQLCFPEKTPQERKRIAKASYQNLMDIVVETIKAYRLPADKLLARVKCEAEDERAFQYLQSQTPIICLAAHQANWEWLLLAGCARYNVPFDAIYKPLKNKNADDVMFGIRSRFGAKPIIAKKLLKTMARRRKEFRVYTLVADQTPGNANNRIWFECFGVDTAFQGGIEKLARKFNYPVTFVQVHRVKRGHYRYQFKLIADPPYDDLNEHDIMRQYVAMFEQQVKDYPEQWLWSNRRWKHTRPKDTLLYSKQS